MTSQQTTEDAHTEFFSKILKSVPSSSQHRHRASGADDGTTGRCSDATRSPGHGHASTSQVTSDAHSSLPSATALTLHSTNGYRVNKS